MSIKNHEMQLFSGQKKIIEGNFSFQNFCCQDFFDFEIRFFK